MGRVELNGRRVRRWSVRREGGGSPKGVQVGPLGISAACAGGSNIPSPVRMDEMG